MCNSYYSYVFRSELFADEFYRWGNGIVDDLWSTKWSNMKRIYIPFPIMNEQQRIADYLDDKCTKIDTIIAKQQTVIEKLKEYKLSVITEAVTKGLNPDVEMKDSGIEWVGKIPEKWKVIKLKYIADSAYRGNGITKDDIDDNGNVDCVRYGEIYTKYNYCFEECLTKTNLEKIQSQKYFSYGDVLFALTGELVEEIGKCVTYLGKANCLAGGDVLVLKHSENPTYLGYALNSKYVQEQKSYGKAKLKVVHISQEEIKNLNVALPPKSEQIKIADFLNKKCKDIENLICQKRSIIDKLTEYKKSLIYEVVTGKKEV